MKIGLLADLHLRGKDLQEASAALDSALAEMRARGVEWVLCAGDVFDNPNILDRHGRTGTVLDAFLRPCERFGIPWLVVEGNHDASGPRDHGALTALRGREIFQVITRPQVVRRVSGPPCTEVNVACLPWASKAHWLAQPGNRELPPEEQASRWQAAGQAVLQGLRRQLSEAEGFRILLGHVEVAGSVNSYKFILPGSTWCFSQTDLEGVGADLVALGHYHLRQGSYLGALRQLSHGEEGNPSGWLFLDTATGQREFVDVDAPRYFTVRADSYRPADFREWDRVRILGAEPPGVELPANARFEREVEEKSAAIRDGAADLDPGAPLHQLVAAWLRAQGQDAPDVAPLLPLIAQLEQDAGGAVAGAAAGSLSRIRSVRIAGLGPHVDTRVDFRGGDWWAIMGPNGSGKTYLLEAILAGLYGCWAHPYRGSLYDSIPGTEGVLEVEFDAEGSTWRAYRRLRRTGKSQSAEALLSRLDGDRWAAVAGPKVKDFDLAVERLVGPLGLVLGSIFLSQKAEGDLVSADAAGRKEFMRRFLQLDRFDPLSEAAKVRANRLEGELSARETQLLELPRLREGLPGLVAVVAEAQANVARLEANVAEREAGLEVLRQKGEDLAGRAKARQALVSAVDDARRGADAAAQAVQDLRSRVAGYEAQLAREPELREQAAALPGVRAELERLGAAVATYEAALRTHQEAQRQVQDLERQVGDLEARERDQQARLEREPELRRQAEEIPVLRAALDSLRGRATERAQAQARRAELEGEVQRHRAALEQAERDLRREVETLGTTIEQARGDAARCKERGQSLQSAGCAAQGYLPCPLIDGARADVARAEEILARIASLEETQGELELALLTEEFAPEARAALAQAILARDAVQVPAAPDVAEMARLQGRLEDLSAVERHLGTLDQVRQSLEQVRADLVARRAALDSARSQAAAAPRPEAPDRTAEIRLREQETRLAAVERELGGLEQVRQVVEQAQADLAARQGDLAAAEQRHADARAAADQAEDVSAMLEDLRAAYQQAQQLLAGVRRELGDAQVALGQARQAVEGCRRRVQELELLDASLALTRVERDGYRLLQAACGKDGIPQLLISAAIPAIESIVQEVCRVDFAGQFGLRFDTVRTLKSGGSRESFDILFSRPGAPEYDARSCSGGEEAAVRAAIRVALVLYQAQRASGSYRVCWLDEPAAHQDQENAEATLRMLDRLRDRFAQAFVVSHDDELLAGFEHRVELVPGPGGTHVAGAAAPVLEGVAA